MNLEILSVVLTGAAVLLGVWRIHASYEARNEAAHAELGKRIDASREEVGQRIDASREEVSRRIDASRAELGGRIDVMNQRMDTLVQLLARPGTPSSTER